MPLCKPDPSYALFENSEGFACAGCQALAFPGFALVHVLLLWKGIYQLLPHTDSVADVCLVVNAAWFSDEGAVLVFTVLVDKPCNSTLLIQEGFERKHPAG